VVALHASQAQPKHPAGGQPLSAVALPWASHNPARWCSGIKGFPRGLSVFDGHRPRCGSAVPVAVVGTMPLQAFAHR
jgi:hypothetical protein